MTTHGAGRGVDIALRLMDHQIVAPSGALLGNVDNLLLRHEHEALVVTGVVSGPGGFGPRQPGLLGRWIVAVWRRLRPEEDPRPVVVSMSHVRTIGSAIMVSDFASRVLAETNGLEQWLRRHVISRIPGAGADEDASPDRLDGAGTSARGTHEELALPAEAHLVSALLGASVVDSSGTSLGWLIELRAEAFEMTGLEVGRLRITGVVFGPRRLGGELGYTTERDQGPWLLARGLRWWHRHDRQAPWGDVVDIDWDRAEVVLAAGRTWHHPHSTPGE